MHLQRLLNTKIGVFIVSAILGLGLAMLFRKACDGKNCIEFKGPAIHNIDGKIYQFGDSCYTYDLIPAKCNSQRKTIEIQNDKSKQNMHMNIQEKDVKSAFENLGGVS